MIKIDPKENRRKRVCVILELEYISGEVSLSRKIYAELYADVVWLVGNRNSMIAEIIPRKTNVLARSKASLCIVTVSSLLTR
jgi:hypothetical protein